MRAIRERPPIYVIEFETPSQPSRDVIPSWKQAAGQRSDNHTQRPTWLYNKNDHPKRQDSITKSIWANVVRQSPRDTTRTKTNIHPTANKKAHDAVLDEAVSTIGSGGTETNISIRAKESQKAHAEQAASCVHLWKTNIK